MQKSKKKYMCCILLNKKDANYILETNKKIKVKKILKRLLIDGC